MVISNEVMLTQREMLMGAQCGVMRNIASIMSGHEPANGFDEEKGDDPWNVHIEGACGEVAAAKILNRFWSPTVNTFSAPDIGRNLQVRTRSEHWYDLYIRPKTDKHKGDNPDNTFILMTGTAPHFIIRGYMLARDAQREDWVKTYGGRPPAWFVEQKYLSPWTDLLTRAPEHV
jgi:hypothetical protein